MVKRKQPTVHTTFTSVLHVVLYATFGTDMTELDTAMNNGGLTLFGAHIY